MTCHDTRTGGTAKPFPTKDVKPSVALKPRTRVHFARVDAKELPELLRKIEAYSGTPFTRFALQLIALTFVRTTELIAARWEEFDLEVAEWRIRATRMKMRTPHIVPLSGQTVDTLRCLHELRAAHTTLLFPGEKDRRKPMSNNTILGALKRMGYAGRTTGHGFRGVAFDRPARTGLRSRPHRAAARAHGARRRVGGLNFATYLPARRKMMQAWAEYLDVTRQVRATTPTAA